MNEIKFSHIYRKFPDNWDTTEFKLIHVFTEDTSTFKESMLAYDTEYWNDDDSDILRYPLPKGKVLVLFFQGEPNVVFTTIRRLTPEKEKYYKSKVGEKYRITITKELA